jgi:hypothetical protein
MSSDQLSTTTMVCAGANSCRQCNCAGANTQTAVSSCVEHCAHAVDHFLLQVMSQPSP